MVLFCNFLLICLSVLFQSVMSASEKTNDAQDREDSYKSYAKLLNNIVKVNEQRVDAMRKLAELQDLDVARYSRSGIDEDDEDNNIYLVVLDDNRSGNSSDLINENEKTNLRATYYSYRRARGHCRRSCRHTLELLCKDYKCGRGFKRSYPKECKEACIKHIKE